MCAAKRSPLGTPKGWSRSKKAKKRRSAAFFLTLFHFSPIDPSGAECLYPHSVGADACIGPHRVDANLHVGRRGRRPRRPARLLPFYGRSVGRGLDPSWQLRGCARLPGRIWNPPLRENINFAIRQNCTGRRGRRPLQINRKIAIKARCLGGVNPLPTGPMGKGT